MNTDSLYQIMADAHQFTGYEQIHILRLLTFLAVLSAAVWLIAALGMVFRLGVHIMLDIPKYLRLTKPDHDRTASGTK